MRTPPLLADFIHHRVCKPICEKLLTLPRFDLEQFNRDRAYESRRRPLETACGSFYVQAFESPAERYSWLDEISDPQLVERLHGLSDADLELLTQIVIDGKSYREAAKVFSCSHQNISRHIARIRKNLS